MYYIYLWFVTSPSLWGTGCEYCPSSNHDADHGGN